MRVELLQHRSQHASLSGHSLLFARALPEAGVPKGAITVEVRDIWRNVTGHARGSSADGGALHDVDGQTADCPDELLEAMQVDEDRILDVDAGERLHGLPGRLDARVLDAGGELRPVLGSPLVEAVEQALVATVPSPQASGASSTTPHGS